MRAVADNVIINFKILQLTVEMSVRKTAYSAHCRSTDAPAVVRKS